MPECVRCGTALEARSSGIADRLGLTSYEGYECRDCGTLLCGGCYRKRTIELAGGSHDRCPTCDGLLLSR
ncbi:hypothetical protein Hbl1158_01975 [Halobaculum sp. CBA1158]|uniref:hypothetical protein n=1 Tax=Halobaculum sp. CBA1158 TaxID=2904243 RepID=UPI001F2F519B|nr:hypothetical protein [Halobaculum sp. CBA1158]UIP00164.1 hypothetical protein Hbl1158_01975 [Halobaculum sp. CBA1158]